MKRREAGGTLPARMEHGRIVEHQHDPYKRRAKMKQPAVCSECGAVYQEGRWHWLSYPAPAGAERTICQACHRIKDRYPAGWITLTGNFVDAHRDEIIGLARHSEQREKLEHPLHRIMDIKAEGDGLTITTTDIHLPRRIVHALRDAYRGELDFHYDKESYSMRANWVRND